jgi:hypothetical protein
MLLWAELPHARFQRSKPRHAVSLYRFVRQHDILKLPRARVLLSKRGICYQPTAHCRVGGHDDKQRDYCETFDDLRNLLPTGKDKPALGILAHTKKPQLNEKRTGGTALMHLLAGSYILTSVPRSIFIMVRGTDDETDNSVVWFNPKNSNGKNAPRSAWHRTGSGFTLATNFDWTEFEKAPNERKTVTLEHLRAAFEGGGKRLELKDAALALAALAGIEEGSAYNALRPGGKWTAHLSRDGKFITFKP